MTQTKGTYIAGILLWVFILMVLFTMVLADLEGQK